jgi:hypothetical protein
VKGRELADEAKRQWETVGKRPGALGGPPDTTS